MPITKTTENCKVGRKFITYELDEERCKKALQIVLNSKPPEKMKTCRQVNRLNSTSFYQKKGVSV
jgi:hypothetical protein